MRARAVPLVSVVLPYRDAERTLLTSVRSVLAQRLTDFELLLVNDGSSDRGPALMSAMARRDARLRLLEAPSRGLVAALNHGLSEARAPLVARMDADDLMHPSRLELQHAFLCAHDRVCAVGARVDAFPERAIAGGMREYLRWQDQCLEPEQIRDQIYVEAPMVHPTVMMRRDVVIAHGGYRDGAFPEDYDLWLRLISAGETIAKLPQRLLRWRVHATSTSRTDPRYARDAFDRLRCRYLAADPRLNGARALAIWGAGRRTRARAGTLLREGVAPTVWVDIDRRKIGNRIDGVPVVAPGWLAHEGPARVFVLGYVASHGAREQIASALNRMGFRTGDDFLMVG